MSDSFLNSLENENSIFLGKKGVAKLEAVKMGVSTPNKLDEPNFLKDMKSILMAAHEVIDNTAKGIKGLSSGFTELDEVTGGFYPQEMTMIAGRPRAGKSAMLLQMALNMAQKSNKKVLLASYEVSQAEIGLNILSNQSKINSMIFKTKKLRDSDRDKIKQISEDIKNISLFVIDQNSVNLEKLEHLVKETKPDILMVDYINIMPDIARYEGKKDSLAEISRRLLYISKNNNIPVIVIAAIGKEAEKRTVVNFKLSDLRDCSELEYDAHKVFFLWQSEENIIIDIKKNRNGPENVNISLKFDRQFHHIYDGNK